MVKSKLELEKFAKKKFGQNFLKNDIIIDKIIKSIPQNNLDIIEIGSGLGDLTKKLIKVCNRVIAFEIDIELFNYLNILFKNEINTGVLKIELGDVFNYWTERRLINQKYNLVANLPYYLATKIILKAFKDDSCKSILVMVQKEIAEKFSAKAKSKNFGSLAILSETVSSVKMLFDIPPENFYPPPKVISTILLIEKHSSEIDIEFEKFLKISFQQPRKKLLKNLALAYGINKIESIFFKINLDSNIRPHQVITSTYHQIFKIIKGSI